MAVIRRAKRATISAALDMLDGAALRLQCDLVRESKAQPTVESLTLSECETRVVGI